MASSSSTPFFLFLFFSSILLFAPSSSSSSSNVSVDLYYESLCPYSASFVVDYLAKLFENGLISVVDLVLVPYGNARIKPNGTISCQHGYYECLLNTVEACAISAWPDLHEHFRFIYCVESLVMEHKYTEWQSCFQKTGLKSEAILDCLESGNGEKLELQYATQTYSLHPAHRYVPWVVVNGQPLYEDYEDVEAYICKAYKGELPKACAKVPLVITLEIKANRLDHVCHDNELMRTITASSEA